MREHFIILTLSMYNGGYATLSGSINTLDSDDVNEIYSNARRRLLDQVDQSRVNEGLPLLSQHDRDNIGVAFWHIGPAKMGDVK